MKGDRKEKKVLSIILSILMIFSISVAFFGCGKEDEKDDEKHQRPAKKTKLVFVSASDYEEDKIFSFPMELTRVI